MFYVRKELEHWQIGIHQESWNRFPTANQDSTKFWGDGWRSSILLFSVASKPSFLFRRSQNIIVAWDKYVHRQAPPQTQITSLCTGTDLVRFDSHCVLSVSHISARSLLHSKATSQWVTRMFILQSAVYRALWGEKLQCLWNSIERKLMTSYRTRSDYKGWSHLASASCVCSFESWEEAMFDTVGMVLDEARETGSW